ncbi:MAG: AP2/ERF family transcription factor [Gemmatimonadota bacterium]|nr:AP2/ERF family transcription factor [Gemmatimonadota bacterium]
MITATAMETKELRLTDGSTVLVNDADFWRFWKHRLSAYPSGIVYFREENRVYLLHREIVDVRDRRIVIHLDGDPRNCTRENLLVQDRGVFARGRKGHGSSPYKGVSRYRNGKWQATIRIDGKLLWLGAFNDPAEAATAYDEAVLKYRGRSGLLNFPTRRRRRSKDEPRTPETETAMAEAE